jgi:hypothetical protein
MVAAIASRELGEVVNRKRAQRVMREHQLLQPVRGLDRRRRPGYFRVHRPDELWHMDMTKVWTAQHGWVYLHVIVDCCTREVTGWRLDLRTRSVEAIGCVEQAVTTRTVPAGLLTLGTDNGSQFTRWTSESTSPPEASHTAVAATETPSPRRSSSPGSASSRSDAPGEPSGKTSNRPERRSTTTTTATTTGPTPGWPTEPSRRDLARHARPTHRSDLNRQRQRGPRQEHHVGPGSRRQGDVAQCRFISTPFSDVAKQQYLSKHVDDYCGSGGTGVACPVGLGVDGD